MGIFSLQAAGFFSYSWLRCTQGARRNTRAQVWALADARGTCSGGSKSQVLTGRHSEHVGPSRSLKTPVKVKRMSGGSCDIWDLECHQRRQTLLPWWWKSFPRHHARHATTFNTIKWTSMTSEWYGLFSRIWPLDGWAFSPATHSCTSITMFKVNNSTQQDCCTSMI